MRSENEMSNEKGPFLAVRVESTGQVFRLGGVPLTIGRRADNTIVLPDSLVSRQHARIEWQADGPVLHDLGSTHGTYVNGRRVSGPRSLQPGYVLRVGDTILQVEAVKQQASVPAPMPPVSPPAGPRTPGWLLIAGVTAGLVVALALLLAAGGAFRPAGGDAGTLLPNDAQVEEAALTSLPTASPAALPGLEADTVEVEPTALPSPVPTSGTSSTAVPTAAPTTALPPTSAPPQNTPVPEFPAPSLVAPTEDEARAVRGHVTFVWSYPRALGAGEGFQVLIWKEGQEHNGAAGLTRDTQQAIDLDAVLPGRGGAGDYFWTVVVRRDAPGEALLSPEAAARRLVYAPDQPAPLPNECASFSCDGCDSWNSANSLCSLCQCP